MNAKGSHVAISAMNGVTDGVFSFRLSATVCVLLCVIVLLPLLLCSPLPLSDYPNHMARAYITANLDASSYLSKYYAIDWSLIPNLAGDILIPPLMKVMDPEAAMLVFVAATHLLLVGGVIAVSYALYGRVSLFTMLAFMLLYNRHFLWGFVNYLFSVAMMLWLLAAWVWCRDRISRWARVLFIIPATALFIGHLHAYVVYGAMITGYEAHRFFVGFDRERSRRWTDFVMSMLQFVTGPVLLVAGSPIGARAGEISYGGIGNKAAGLLDLFNNYNLGLDVLTLFVFVLIYALGLWRRTLKIDRGMLWPLAGLAIIYPFIPTELFNSFGADRRLLIAWALLLLAVTELKPVSRKVFAGCATAMVVLFAVRMGVIASNWIRADGIYSRLMLALDHVGKGERVAFFAASLNYPWLQNPPLDHVADVVVLRKEAFINALFATRGKQILRVVYNTDTPYYQSESQVLRFSASHPQVGDVFSKLPQGRFDWLLLINRQHFDGQPRGDMHIVWQDPEIDSVLYRIQN